MPNKDHWENVYATKPTQGVSWFQEHAERSLDLVQRTDIAKDASIIDVGGGASTLVDDLLSMGYTSLTVLDLSAAALAAAQKRLGARADAVQWLEADITSVELPRHAFDVWHDRAVFHFLTTEEQRKAYIERVKHAVKPGGHVIIATFSEDGPTQCSGLPIMRYSADALQAEFGDFLTLKEHIKEDHHTPFETIQKFVYCYFRKG